MTASFKEEEVIPEGSARCAHCGLVQEENQLTTWLDGLVCIQSRACGARQGDYDCQNFL